MKIAEFKVKQEDAWPGSRCDMCPLPDNYREISHERSISEHPKIPKSRKNPHRNVLKACIKQ